MINEIIERNGRRWKVRQAKSEQHALNAIIHASVTGSVGCTTTIDHTYVGGIKEIVADVVEINSDGTERQPYTQRY